MTRYPYCIQCTDQRSGKVGCFAYDPAEGKTAGNFHAITPVFDNLGKFYTWAKKNSFPYHHGRSTEMSGKEEVR